MQMFGNGKPNGIGLERLLHGLPNPSITGESWKARLAKNAFGRISISFKQIEGNRIF
jgi:hypothetical protein